MTDPGATTEVLGKAGEPCRECGAPLAADQRYCLNCGRRRGEPRIEYERHRRGAGAAGANGDDPAQAEVGSPDTNPSPARKSQRDYTPLAAVGGIAVLGAMLLIGVLIGRGDGSGTATTPAPVVVQPGETGGGKTAANEEEGAASSEAKQANTKGKGKSGGEGGAVKGGSANTGSAPVASDEALQKLQEQSPQEYSESSAKLPDEVATGGAPPPEDNKAPGGGSKGTAIE
jgi:hypothetical protein